MSITQQEQKICDDAVTYVKEHKKSLVTQYTDINKVPADISPVAIFMAGSPGAGKTEFAEKFLQNISNDGMDIIFIDPDKLRTIMPGYEGGNSHLFQKSVSRLINEMYPVILKQKQSFLLDGTMSSLEQARQNINRALKREYQVYIFYVYQDPISAWRFTQAREKIEGRRIQKETFVRQFFSAADVVNTIKQEYKKETTVQLIIKDSYHNVKQFEKNIDCIDSYIKHKYNEDTLNSLLHNSYDF